MLGDVQGDDLLHATSETSAMAYNGSLSQIWAYDEDSRPCLKMGLLRLSLRCRQHFA